MAFKLIQKRNVELPFFGRHSFHNEFAVLAEKEEAAGVAAIIGGSRLVSFEDLLPIVGWVEALQNGLIADSIFGPNFLEKGRAKTFYFAL
jgi:hypothetical protein